MAGPPETNPYASPEARGEPACWQDRPWWVRLGVWPTRRRMTAVTLNFVVLFAFIVVLLVVSRGWAVGRSFSLRLYAVLAILCVFVPWGWLAIRWIDKHGRWPTDEELDRAFDD